MLYFHGTWILYTHAHSNMAIAFLLYLLHRRLWAHHAHDGNLETIVAVGCDAESFDGTISVLELKARLLVHDDAANKRFVDDHVRNLDCLVGNGDLCAPEAGVDGRETKLAEGEAVEGQVEVHSGDGAVDRTGAGDTRFDCNSKGAAAC